MPADTRGRAASSAKIAGLVLLLWVDWRLFTPSTPNPFSYFLFISHRVPLSSVLLSEPSAALSGDTIRYQKGYGDLAFLAFYIVVFSCLRQTTTLYVFLPFAKWWGIKNERKQERFVEQGYALLYWGSAGLFGLVSCREEDRGKGTRRGVHRSMRGKHAREPRRVAPHLSSLQLDRSSAAS